jgi:ATP-dependent Clp protease protease subunit
MKSPLMQLLRDNAQQSRERKPLNLVRNSDTADSSLYLYDVIDGYWGVSAKDVAAAVSQANPAGTLHLRINSPGGDVFEARAMATALREFGGTVVAHVDGLAASAATTVACAASEILMGPGAFWMIHNAWSVAFGNKKDMQDMAALLDKIDGDIVADYARVCGQSPQQVAAWMDAETWMTAEEAVTNGFARLAVEPDGDEDGQDDDNDGDGKKMTARWNLAAYQHAPKALIKPAPTAPDWAAVHANNARRLRLLQIA